ncbi:amidase family protein [Allostreptomyces psammosilenae]|uniref:Asp-tRNA(Asn)/Glu-tRNA(Gln) amidotransferase A subunit family amidase n=1 Tax=Allostreptomyces psammosilenae TaxID=1892865 RepID=A0A852ZX27_9ACTN|nr:amidase [Allostreptomyces psammosilenae]NYI06953.1 Asp-tRNA(Asn)/Glu-tRNA(Gln) amidotransferase A subunit family amidase [Allostreptomyces psammosilenae]
MDRRTAPTHPAPAPAPRRAATAGDRPAPTPSTERTEPRAQLPPEGTNEPLRLPGNLGLPLHSRVRLITRGSLPAIAWRAEANAWARAADERYRATTELRALGPTDGDIRLGVKDTVDAAGFATRLGLRHHRHYPARSAAALRGLRGVSVIAKLVTPELSIGRRHGARNPRFPRVDPAGSSTGSAVAVAASICDVALGTDTVASVRLPAAACGVVGLRATHRADQLDGVFPLSPPLDAPGWIARTADDLSYFWYRSGLGGPLPPALPPGETFRVGVVAEALDGPNTPEVRGALDTLRDALADSGHRLVTVRLGRLWEQRGAAYELCARTALDAYRRWRAGADDPLEDATRSAIEAGAEIGDARHAEITATLRAVRGTVADLFRGQGVDLWLLPLHPVPPRGVDSPPAAASVIPRRGEPDYERRLGYAPVASFAGLPAIAFPAGADPERGAPIAAQAVAAPGAEALLIRFAQEAARLLGDPLAPAARPAPRPPGAGQPVAGGEGPR